MVEEENLGFPVLIDAALEATRAYGILNEEDPRVPHPTVIIVDKAGVVQFVHLDEDYRRRPSPEVLLEALRKIPREEMAAQ